MDKIKTAQDNIQKISYDILLKNYDYEKLVEKCRQDNSRLKELDEKLKEAYDEISDEIKILEGISDFYVRSHKDIWLNCIYKPTVESCPPKDYKSQVDLLQELEGVISFNKSKLVSLNKEYDAVSKKNDVYIQRQKQWLSVAIPIFHKAMIMNIRIEMNATGFSFCSANSKNPSGLYPTGGKIKSRGFKHAMFMLFHLPEYIHLSGLCNSAMKVWADLINPNSGKGLDLTLNLKSDMNKSASSIKTAENTIQDATEYSQKVRKYIEDMKPFYEIVKDGEEGFYNVPFSKICSLPIKTDYKSVVPECFEKIVSNSDYSDKVKELMLQLCHAKPDFKEVKAYFDDECEKRRNNLPEDVKKLAEEHKSIASCLEKMGKDEEEMLTAIDKMKNECLEKIADFADLDPIRLFTLGVGNHLNDNPELAVDKVLDIAAKRITLGSLFSQVDLKDGKDSVGLSLSWQEKEHKCSTNIMLSTFDKSDNIENSLNNLLVTLLASFPVGKAKFTFVDLQMQGGAGEIFRRLPNNISQVILSENDLRKKIASLKDMVSRVSIHTNNIVEFNENAGSITHPYEFVIWRNYTGADRDPLHEGDIMPLIKNGYRYGIYFIIVPQESVSWSKSQLSDYTLPMYLPDDDYQDFAGRFVNSLVNRIIENSKNKKADSVRWNGLAKALQTPPVEIPENGMIIPVGEYPDGEVACYEFNDRFHHSLIIGTSGSGKSYLLHNILLNSMLKYDARYLEFYLMDFKFGGGEFKSYEGMPHVSHLLSDGLDKSIVLEVMRELERKMIERGKMIEQYKKLSVYNAHHPENPLPHIVLVVDEASLLFQIANNKETKLQNEINRILGYIATQGRSQGVTFCFATQTFAGADIPTNILRNITNRFLLKCESADADRLIERNGASISESLTQGYTYMSASQKIARIFDYNYVDGGVNMLRKYQDAICHFNSRPAGRNNFVYDGKASREYSAADIESIKTKKVPTLLLGSGVTVKQEPISVSFRKDMGENLLITGTNGEMQSERVFYNAVMSACEWAAASGKRVNVVCFDNYNDGDDNKVRYEQLNSIGNVSFTSVVNGRSRDEMIVELGSKIRNNTVGDQIYILALLGHERYRRNMGNPLTDIASSQATAAAATNRGASRYMPEENSSRPGMINIGGLAPAPVSSVKSTSSNIEEELMYILNFGPESGVHTIMHVDRPSSIVPVSEKWSRREIQRAFKYISVLNLNSTEISKLPVMEDVSVESLSADNERLRAVFYDDENNKAVLFTPFDFKNNFRIQ